MVKLVSSSYKSSDCVFLLKDLLDVVETVTIEEKERRIANGENYSEMLSLEESVPTEVRGLFLDMVNDEAEKLAKYVGIISDAVYDLHGDDLVIVSLARAGSPIGVLMKKFLAFKYEVEVPHYSVSIIREKGIDENALLYILEKHKGCKIAFVDGWTGKGSIKAELDKSIKAFNEKHGTDLNDDLVVLADPARKASIYGTREDICIPNACLNSTVSGLVSRTVHSSEFIGSGDFHGAIFYKELVDEDFSNDFIRMVSRVFTKDLPDVDFQAPELGFVDGVIATLTEKGVIPEGLDLKKLKFSIGETSRAFIRRIPVVMFVQDKTNPDLRFVLHMAEKKGIPVYEKDLHGYQCLSLLK